jgi:lipopolysaccharide export system permease protein
MIVLNIPSVIVLTIPMGILLSTVMTLNKLSLDSEITVMKACGVGINRIAKPIFIFSVLMCICSFVINETIVPVATKYSKNLALWSLSQKNVPNGKENFVFKEIDDHGIMRRLFYVGNCEDKVLYNITVLDTSKKGTIQVLQANEGKTTPAGWDFQKGAVYTIGERGKILNTTLFDTSNVKFGLDLTKQLNKNLAKEMNFTKLMKYIAKNMKNATKEERNAIVIELFDKLALPITTIVLVLVGVPLAITPPRVRYNRGFLFSILIIFAYYLIRALSISFGEAGTIPPFFAAWLPNIILAIAGLIMYYKKVYTI